MVAEFIVNESSSIELLKHNAGILGGIMGLENEYSSTNNDYIKKGFFLNK